MAICVCGSSCAYIGLINPVDCTNPSCKFYNPAEISKNNDNPPSSSLKIGDIVWVDRGVNWGNQMPDGYLMKGKVTKIYPSGNFLINLLDLYYIPVTNQLIDFEWAAGPKSIRNP